MVDQSGKDQALVCPASHGNQRLSRAQNLPRSGHPRAMTARGGLHGFGIERIAMVMWSINDIRLFTENDVRFLEQF